jgi:F0F1-type ATP synthase epsilon subunit
MSTIHVDVAKVDVIEAETLIFSGEAEFVALPGESGELGMAKPYSINYSLRPISQQ